MSTRKEKLITHNTACPIVRANPTFLGHQKFPPVIPSPALMSIKLTSVEMQTNLSPSSMGERSVVNVVGTCMARFHHASQFPELV